MQETIRKLLVDKIKYEELTDKEKARLIPTV